MPGVETRTLLKLAKAIMDDPDYAHAKLTKNNLLKRCSRIKRQKENSINIEDEILKSFSSNAYLV